MGVLDLFFFSSRLFSAIGSQWAVLLGSFQALGLFLYWPVSRCAKSKGKVHWQVRGGGGGCGWSLRGQGGVVQGGHWGWGVRLRECDGGVLDYTYVVRTWFSSRLRESNLKTNNFGVTSVGCLASSLIFIKNEAWLNKNWWIHSIDSVDCTFRLHVDGHSFCKCQ